MSTLAGLAAITLTIMILRGIIMLGEILKRITGINLMLKYFPFLNEYLEGLRIQGRREYLIKYIVSAYFLVSFIIFYGLLYFISSLVVGNLIGNYSSPANNLGFFQVTVI